MASGFGRTHKNWSNGLARHDGVAHPLAVRALAIRARWGSRRSRRGRVLQGARSRAAGDGVPGLVLPRKPCLSAGLGEKGWVPRLRWDAMQMRRVARAKEADTGWRSSPVRGRASGAQPL